MRIIKDSERIQLAFAGGHLRRWHANDILGEERVDSHTWGMVTLILILHPCPSVGLIAAVQFHDAGEMFSGDIPHPAKLAVPGLGEGDKEVARRWTAVTGLGDCELTSDDKWWLSFTDMAQAYLFATRQVAQGNGLMLTTRDRIAGHLMALRRDLGPGGEHKERAISAVFESQVGEWVTRDIVELEARYS